MAQPKSSGNLIGKISSYLQIVSKDPHSTAFVPLAEAYRQIGLLDDALEAARMGTGTLPHFSPGFATLGRILGQMGRVDEAMSAFARALSIDRQSQSALVGLARLHLVRGERDQARKILLQAAEFHPEDEMIENMLVALDLPRPWGDVGVVAEAAPAAVASVSAGVIPAATVDEEPAKASGSGEPIPTATLAEIYVKQGLADQAMRVYQEILRADPGNPQARARLRELRGESVEEVMPASPVVSPPPSPAAVKVRRQPLEVFEMWLQVIQVRRAHVQ